MSGHRFQQVHWWLVSGLGCQTPEVGDVTTGGGVGNGELCDWDGVGHMLAGLHVLQWLSSVELCPVGAMTGAGI